MGRAARWMDKQAVGHAFVVFGAVAICQDSHRHSPEEVTTAVRSGTYGAVIRRRMHTQL